MPNSQPKPSRRGFFISASVASAAVASVGWLKTPTAVSVAALPQPAPEKGGGYTLSAHVQQYYQTTRV